MARNASDLIHIEMPVHRFDLSDGNGSCERMLHNTLHCVLEAIKTRDPASPQLGLSHPKNEGWLREIIAIVHIEDYGLGLLSFS